MKTFKLLPIDGRKSLSNQHVNQYESEGETFSDLISYTTRVAYYNHTTNKMTVHGYYSPTTARHINAFLDFYGFNTCSKSELENYNNIN